MTKNKQVAINSLFKPFYSEKEQEMIKAGKDIVNRPYAMLSENEKDEFHAKAQVFNRDFLKECKFDITLDVKSGGRCKAVPLLISGTFKQFEEIVSNLVEATRKVKITPEESFGACTIIGWIGKDDEDTPYQYQYVNGALTLYSTHVESDKPFKASAHVEASLTNSVFEIMIPERETGLRYLPTTL